MEFRVVGPLPDGPELPWARALVERARAAGVVWRVADDPFAELADWDLLVLPSREEAFGLVLVEAMAMRVPVIASDIDGPAEIVTADVGLLVPPDRPADLARAIDELLADPARRERLGHAGRIRVEQRYAVEHQATALDRAYRTAIGTD